MFATDIPFELVPHHRIGTRRVCMSAGSLTWQQDAVSAAVSPPSDTVIAQVVDGITHFTFSDLETREAAAVLTGPGAQRQALSCDLLGLYTAEAVAEVLQIVSANGEHLILHAA